MKMKTLHLWLIVMVLFVPTVTFVVEAYKRAEVIKESAEATMLIGDCSVAIAIHVGNVRSKFGGRADAILHSATTSDLEKSRLYESLLGEISQEVSDERVDSITKRYSVLLSFFEDVEWSCPQCQFRNLLMGTFPGYTSFGLGLGWERCLEVKR